LASPPGLSGPREGHVEKEGELLRRVQNQDLRSSKKEWSGKLHKRLEEQVPRKEKADEGTAGDHNASRRWGENYFLEKKKRTW